MCGHGLHLLAPFLCIRGQIYIVAVIWPLDAPPTFWRPIPLNRNATIRSMLWYVHETESHYAHQ